jgi:type VI secretion system secreted protein VgrG
MLLLVGLLSVPSRAYAAELPVGLGTAGTYSVLGGTTVTNTGATTLSGDLGLSPGTSVTGSPTVSGITHVTDAAALQAKSDLTTAYNDAAGRTPVATVSGDLVGQTFTTGVYNSSSSLAVSGTLTLDGGGTRTRSSSFRWAPP